MTANHGHTFQPHVVTAVRDNTAKHYGDLYCCTRDESAWSYGAMSIEDFHTIAHDDDVLDGLAESALEVLSGELAAAEQRGKAEAWNEAADFIGKEFDFEGMAIDLKEENPYRADQMEADQ